MSRYEKPKLNNKTIESVANKYIMKLLNNDNWSLEMVVDFISRDYIYKKTEYYDRCISKVKYGYIKYRLAELDELLDAVKTCLEKPERFGLTKQKDIVTLYPHPVIKNYNVVGTKYSDVKYYHLPDYLFNYMILKDDINNYKNLTMHRQAEICKFFREYNYKPAELIRILNTGERHIKKVITYIKNNTESIDAVIIETVEDIAEKYRTSPAYIKSRLNSYYGYEVS